MKEKITFNYKHSSDVKIRAGNQFQDLETNIEIMQIELKDIILKCEL